MLKMLVGFLALGLGLAAAGLAGAAEPSVSSEVVTVDMRDGTRLVGRVIEDAVDHLRMRTLDGVEIDLPRSRVVAVHPATESEGRLRRLDPNYSRLMFSPTGRPLRKGDGYFSDYELVFPGLSLGLTDNITLSGGVSAIPGLGPGEQLFYISPKIGRELGDRGAFSVGALYATADDEGENVNLGLLYAIGTVGGRSRSLSFGLGVADDDVGQGGHRTPLLMLGGTATVSNHIALVTESWLVLNDHFELGDQPLGFGVRFFGDRVSADVGAVVIPSYLDDGGFLPWVSVSYHFGKSRGNASAAPQGGGLRVSPRSPRPAFR